MPEFEVHQPRTPEEAVRLRVALPDALYVAGGTDLLPNLKHQLHQPRHLISLQRVEGLQELSRAADGTLRLGASLSLHALTASALLSAEVPGLVAAAASVAGPQHRRMGTLGGNVMLDTRCLFYNQTEGWRQALGYCLKKDGTWCHVIGSAKACVAAQSSDTVPMLCALDARLQLRLPDRVEELPIRALHGKDGRFEQNRLVPAESLLEAIVIPPRPAGHRSVYRKVRSRGAVDYPQLSVALAAGFDGPTCTALEIVVGATMPFPKRIEHTGLAVGTRLEDEVIERIAEHVHKQVKPQPQIHGDPSWRRHLARVEARRGLRALRG